MKSFRKSIGQVTGASVASFVISLALTPLMTRLYPPAEYGLFSIVNGWATFGATLILMALPLVLSGEKRFHKRKQIERSIVFLAQSGLVMCAVFTLIGIGIWGRNYGWTMLLLPILVAGIVVHRLAESKSQAENAFGRISVARVVHVVFSKLGAIFFGWWAGPHAAIMLAFETIGYVWQSSWMLGLSRLRNCLRPVGWTHRRFRHTLGLLKANSDATMHGHITSLLLVASAALQTLVIAKQFSVGDSGLFSLAVSISMLPVQLIAIAAGPVVYQKMLATAETHPNNIRPSFARLAQLSLASALVPYAVLWFAGPQIFELAFGQRWQGAGYLAALMSLPFMLHFVAAPMSIILIMARQQKRGLILDAVFLLLQLTTLLVAPSMTTLRGSIGALAVVLTLYRLSQIYLYWHSLTGLSESVQVKAVVDQVAKND